MLDFEFCSPTRFVVGRGAERKLGALVRANGGSKALLHFGGGSIRRNGIYDKVVASLAASGVDFVPLGGVRPNPRSGLVREGIALCRREGVDFVLAVGGGSVIDSAKAIAFGTVCDGDFADRYVGKEAKTMPPIPAALPIGTVLTIAAAGSEGSGNSVITFEETGRKLGCRGECLRPRFSIMNPEFTYSLPVYQIACGAVDMFAHVVERYFTPTRDVAVSDGLCEGLMRAIAAAGLRAVAAPGDYAGRADLVWAGTLAHNDVCGVGRAQDWASHGIEHELSAMYDVAHGAGLAVVMPAWMDYVKNADIDRFARFAARVWDVPPGDPAAMADEGIARFRDWIRRLGMPATLDGLGADPKDIPQLAANLRLGGGTLGSFMPLTEADVVRILESAV